MNDQQKLTLFSIAKQNIVAAVMGEKIPEPESDDPELNENRGCFVTIKNGSELRGCIGQFVADRPLFQMVADMAVSASTGDPRFRNNPIIPEEFDQLEIEISVLSPLERTDDPAGLKLGEHGIYIVRGYHSGCFLPQVATETGWTADEFLANCCYHKAGLPPDAWKDKETVVYLFTCEIFSKPFPQIH